MSSQRHQAHRVERQESRHGLPAEPARTVSARSLLRLTAAERERLLAQAAAVVAHEYEDGASLAGFEALSWEDYVDASLDDD